jgi:hypothetical protein
LATTEKKEMSVTTTNEMEETNVKVTSKLKNLKPQNITYHAMSYTSHTTMFEKVTT